MDSLCDEDSGGLSETDQQSICRTGAWGICGVCYRGTHLRTDDWQHAIYEHRSRQSAGGGWSYVDCSGVATNRCEQRGEVSDAAACIRGLGLHAGGTEDRCAESEVTQCDPADWSEGRRDASAAYTYMDRARARHRVLQHPGQRMARSERAADGDVHAVKRVQAQERIFFKRPQPNFDHWMCDVGSRTEKIDATATTANFTRFFGMPPYSQ